MHRSASARKQRGKSLTEVEQGLNPETSPNKIVIPPVQNADGEGTVAEQYESQSNLIDEHSYNSFSGNEILSSKIAPVLMFVAIGALALLVIAPALNKK